MIAKAAVVCGTEGTRVFRTQIFNLRIQMTDMPPKYDNAGNMVEKGYVRAAQFRHGLLRTDSPDVISAIEKYMGYGLTVWDDEAMNDARAEVVYESLLDRAKADPKIFERLKADLNKVDFIEPEEELPSEPAEMTPFVPPEPETTPLQAIARAAKARGRPKGSKNKPAK